MWKIYVVVQQELHSSHLDVFLSSCSYSFSNVAPSSQQRYWERHFLSWNGSLPPALVNIDHISLFKSSCIVNIVLVVFLYSLLLYVASQYCMSLLGTAEKQFLELM